MRLLLRHRSFARLWLASLVNEAGNWVLIIALPFYVYDLTGSTLATGAMFMVAAVPRLVLGSVAGVFVDRWDRRRTAVIADLARVVVLLPLLLVRSPEWLWVVYAVGFVETTLGQFAGPAKTALLPRLVPDDELVAANGLYALTAEINRLVGPLLGAALLAVAGLTGIVLFDSATFLLSGVLIALIATPAGASPAASVAAPAGGALRQVGREWLAGLRLVPANRLALTVFAGFGVATIGEGMLNVVMVPFVRQVLGGGATELGWIMAAQAVGGLSGGLALSRWGDRLPVRRLVPASGALLGVLLVVFASGPPLPLVLPLATLAGLAVMGFYATLFALLQRGVADAFRGRVLGALATTTALLSLVGMALAGLLGDWLGPAPLVVADGVLALLAAGLVAVLLPRPAAGRDVALVESPAASR
jgi:MFS family permease